MFSIKTPTILLDYRQISCCGYVHPRPNPTSYPIQRCRPVLDIVQDKANWLPHNMRSGAALADAAVVLKGCGVLEEKLNFTVP